MKQIVKRVQAPTPRFFKKLRNAGLVLASISTAVLTAPIALPLLIVKIAEYLAVAGGVTTAISQSVTPDETLLKKEAIDG